MELNVDMESIGPSFLRILVSFRSFMLITLGIKPIAPRYFSKLKTKFSHIFDNIYSSQVVMVHEENSV